MKKWGQLLFPFVILFGLYNLPYMIFYFGIALRDGFEQAASEVANVPSYVSISAYLLLVIGIIFLVKREKDARKA